MATRRLAALTAALRPSVGPSYALEPRATQADAPPRLLTRCDRHPTVTPSGRGWGRGAATRPPAATDPLPPAGQFARALSADARCAGSSCGSSRGMGSSRCRSTSCPPPSTRASTTPRAPSRRRPRRRRRGRSRRRPRPETPPARACGSRRRRRGKWRRRRRRRRIGRASGRPFRRSLTAPPSAARPRACAVRTARSRRRRPRRSRSASSTARRTSSGTRRVNKLLSSLVGR